MTLPIKVGSHVRAARVSSENPGILPADWWVEGTLLSPLKRGNIIHIDRVANPHGRAPGVFTSSEIQMISRNDDGTLFVKTLNSIYRVSLVPESDSES